MAEPAPAIMPDARTPEPDQRVFLHDVSWEQFETILAIRGDAPSPRMYYLDGELELMAPSQDHEKIKTTFGRLVEAWADDREIELDGFGSWTLRTRARKRGAEPDECYTVGGEKDHPDIAIEVVWTSGGLDKLEIYRGLGTREVWMWRDGEIGVYALRGDRYERMARSEVLPELDLALVASFLLAPSQSGAVRAFRAALRAR